MGRKFLLERHTDAVRIPPYDLAVMHSAIDADHQIKRFGYSQRRLDLQTCAGDRHITHRAIDCSGAIEFDRAGFEDPMAATGASFVHRQVGLECLERAASLVFVSKI